MCHVLHYSCNVNADVADSLHCRMICGTASLISFFQNMLAALKQTVHYTQQMQFKTK